MAEAEDLSDAALLDPYQQTDGEPRPAVNALVREIERRGLDT